MPARVSCRPRSLRLLALITCAGLSAACKPTSPEPRPPAKDVKPAMEAPVAHPSAPPRTTSSTTGAANAAPDAHGRLEVEAAGTRVQIDGCALTRESDTLTHCEGDTHIRITRDGKEVAVMVTSLYLDSQATLYRGRLGRDSSKGYSLIVTDVDGDGHEDLIVWTGRDGAYGGPSYDVLLFEPNDGQFYAAPAFSELTVGANGLFSIEDGRLKLTSTDGCCTRYLDTYAVEAREPKLVERITEEKDEQSDNVRRKVERLIEGKMQEVK